LIGFARQRVVGSSLTARCKLRRSDLYDPLVHRTASQSPAFTDVFRRVDHRFLFFCGLPACAADASVLTRRVNLQSSWKVRQMNDSSPAPRRPGPAMSGESWVAEASRATKQRYVQMRISRKNRTTTIQVC
jgi:hypothetical protein